MTSKIDRRAEVAQLLADGFLPIRLHGWGDFKNRKAPVDEGFLHRAYRAEGWQTGEGIGLRLGLHPNGLRVYVLDMDSHGPTQHALKFLNWIHFQMNASLWRRFFEDAQPAGMAGTLPSTAGETLPTAPRTHAKV